MNKDKHHMLWLMLPAVLVVLYFAIFQPGPDADSAPDVSTAVPETGTLQVDAPEAANDVVNTDEARQTAGTASLKDEEEVAQDREFINYAFPLLSTWNLQEVKPLLADETIATSSDEEIKEVMAVLEDRLGSLKYFETPEPVDTANSELDQAEAGTLQHYQFIAYYEAGEAEIDLILQKQFNDNSLYSFNIHVPN